MHLLFYGRLETTLLQHKLVEAQLREQSIKEGIVFDSPSSVSSIPSFIQTYKIPVDELLITDIETGYKCFNEFFYRYYSFLPPLFLFFLICLKET